MALLGTYGGADDVRLCSNRLGAPQAGGIYGGGGSSTSLTEVCLITTEVGTVADGASFKVDGLGSNPPEAWNVLGGTLPAPEGQPMFKWFVNSIERPNPDDLLINAEPGNSLAPIAIGDCVHYVRYGVSSVTGATLTYIAPSIIAKQVLAV